MVRLKKFIMATKLLYKNYLFVAGGTLLVLGLGNYIAAHVKVKQYQGVRAEIAPQLHTASSFLLYEDSSPFPNEARERWEIARAKLGFYHVVQSGGRLMMSIGAICILLALIRLRRQRIYAYRSFR